MSSPTNLCSIIALKAVEYFCLCRACSKCSCGFEAKLGTMAMSNWDRNKAGKDLKNTGEEAKYSRE